ncbi:unnamed protein product [Arabis nemorensis]|uniref:TF-B3 domain-containing protein n=1 Tax=Arabis nemorensis TaxID=586526 RepID=A0A565C1H9_9BRAS|nr:unnamed protein product [Arabis nemorensis]
MKNFDSPMASAPDNWNDLKMLADVAAREYDARTTKKDSSKSPPCPSTKPRVSLSKPSRSNSKLLVLAEVAAMFALEREKEQEARITVNVPRKKRTHRSHRSSSSMATTTPWTRVIEKQRSVELQNPETSPSSCFYESKKRRVSIEEEERSLKKRRVVRRFEEELRVQQNPNLDLGSSSVSTINVSKQEEERSTRKKPKLVLLPTQTNPPEWLLNVMMREGNGYNPKLIIAKKLYQSDLDRVQTRLSIPLNQVVNSDFLTEEESRIIYEQSVLKIRKEGVSVDLVDPLLNKHVVNLRKWKMSGGWNYVFVDSWNDVVAKNTFKVNDVFHVWSFRSGRGKLCFALVPPLPTRNSSQCGGSTSGESGHKCSSLA